MQAAKESPAETPTISVPAPDVPRKRIFTPTQIRIAAIVGGPLAATYMLESNFNNLEDSEGSRWTLILGLGAFGLLMLIYVFLPVWFGRYLFPAMAAAASGSIAQSQQMTTDAIRESDKHDFEPAWKVAAIAIGGAIITLVTSMALLRALGKR